MTSLFQNWKTPKAFYQGLDCEFGFTFDPCPPSPTFDGLSIAWGRVNFVNPPFKTIDLWVRKAFRESQSGNTVVLLIPSRTDTRWWHDCVMRSSEIRFVKGRLKYGDGKSNAPFPSCVVIFRGMEREEKK
jgi:hypothetical protein